MKINENFQIFVFIYNIFFFFFFLKKDSNSITTIKKYNKHREGINLVGMFF
jgi:hypothetical protein